MFIRLLASLLFLLAAVPPMFGAGSTSIVISQVYGGGGNSGATYKNDFIELYNLSATPVTVTGWSVQYSSAAGTAWQVTNLTGTIPPGKYYLVQEAVGAGGTTNLPTPDATGTIAMSGTSGKVALVSNTTALAVSCPTGLVDLAGYGTANCFEGASAVPALSNTTAGIRKGGGSTDTDVNSADFATGAPTPRNSACCALSITTASPLPNGIVNTAYSQTFTATGASGSPIWALAAGSTLPFDFAISSAGVLTGTPTSTAGSPFTFTIQVTGGSNATTSAQFQLTVTGAPTCTVTHSISQIQGSGDTSLFAGNIETTSGIVTARKSNGFFLQMPDPGDGDPSTSDGIFVFTSSAPPTAAAVGNSVCVIGNITEFIPSSDPASPPVTEINVPSSVTVLAMNQTLPAAVVLTALEMAPNSAIDNLEKYEGMRVQVNSLVVVGPTEGTVNEANATSNSNGVFYGVIQGIARPFREPGIQLPDALPAGSPANIPRFDSNPERLRIDTKGQAGSTILDVAAGTTITALVGPLDFGFRTYTILTDPAPAPTAGPNASFTAVPVPLASELTVASFNMERFFDTVNDPATSDVVLTQTAFNNRLNKMSLAIRNVLNSPDIIGVEEMENLTTLQALAAKVNADAVAALAPNPNYTGYLVEGNDIGGIDVGFLVQSAKVNVIDVVQYGLSTTYIDPNTGLPALLNDRPPLVLRATSASGANTVPLPVTVIVNHMRSLSNVDDPVDGNRVRTKRRAQAEFLANLIQARQAASPTENIISLGDYNAFAFNDGYGDSIGTIKGMPAPADQVVLASPDLVNPNLVSLTDTLPADQRYSFNFDGNAQELDHVLVNSAIFPRFTRFVIARLNSDFPESFRNDANRPERISDHDPAVAYFLLPGASEVTGQVKMVQSGLGYNRATRLFNGTITITNNGAQTIAAPIQVVLNGLTSGITLANSTGSFGGSPYVTSNTNLASGQSVAVPVQYSNPGNLASNLIVKIYSGAF